MAATTSPLEAPIQVVVERVEAPPGQPPSTDVRVLWQQPASPQGAAVLAYSFRVYRKRSDAGGASFKSVYDGRDCKCVVTGLRPYTAYDFKVQSYTYGAQGPCPSHPPVSITTATYVPQQPPALRLERLSTDEIEVAWDPPPATSLNGPLRGFRLFYDEPGTADYVEVQLRPARRSHTVTHLFPDKTYRIQILAFNDAGEGPESDILLATTQAPAAKRFLKGEKLESQPGKSQARIISRQQSLSGRSFQAAAASALHPDSPELPRRSMPGGTAAKKRPSLTLAAPSRAATSTKAKGEEASPIQALRAQQRAHIPKRRSMDDWQSRARACDDSPPQSDSPDPQPSPSQSVTPSKVSLQLVSPPPGKLAHGTVYPKARSKPTYAPRARSVSQGIPINRTEQSVAADRAHDILELDGVDIKSMTGTIRGKKHGVRARLQVIAEQDKMQSGPMARVFQDERNGKIVVYVTSVKAIRNTYQRCQDVRKLFYNLRLKVKFKDISMHEELGRELEERLPGAVVPQVFVNGAFFGDFTKVMEVNETGQLKTVFDGFETRPLGECEVCGGEGYILCLWCQGSKKSLHHPFEKDDRSKMNLKCTVCNEIGLQQCTACQ